MININYNGEKYKFPSAWSEVTLQQFQDINKLALEEDVDDGVALISILSGMSLDKILDLPITEYHKLVKICKFKDDKSSEKPQLTFQFNKIWYGYQYKISNMTTSEFIDYSTLSKPDIVAENMHILMAILYRPATKYKKPKNDTDLTYYDIEKYDANTVMERAELFKELRMDVVLSAISFLLALSQASLAVITDYSTKPSQESKKISVMKSKKMKQTLVKNGDGSTLFTNLLDLIRKNKKRG